MPHIALPGGLPGISSGFAYRPETAKPMRELAEVLLRGPHSLTSGEREMIATFVSIRNECQFCLSSHQVTSADVARARDEGATDLEIHDAVLIAAAFCMYNRYVDGLATFTPADPAAYDQMGRRLAKDGYVAQAAAAPAATAGAR